MGDPVSLALIGMAAGAAGAGVSAFGNLFQGQAQSNLFNYQAGVAGLNAKLAQQDANYAESAGEVEAQQQGMRGRAEVGTTRAGFGAGNISLTSGSPSDVIKSETEITQQNEAMTRSNAAKRAFGFNVTGAEDIAQAGVYRMSGSYAKAGADIGATSSIIGGIGSVSSKWLAASQSGIFSSPSGGVNPDSALGRQTYANSIYA